MNRRPKATTSRHRSWVGSGATLARQLLLCLAASGTLVAGPATAQEDRLRLIEINTDSIRTYTLVESLQVTAKKITIREIIERATRGERTKLAGRDNMTCTTTLRSVSLYKKKKEVNDSVFRAYSDVRGNSRWIHLDESKRKYKLRDSEWVVDQRGRRGRARRHDLDGHCQ
jgi:hypothetical protein